MRQLLSTPLKKLSACFCFITVMNMAFALDFGIGGGFRIDVSPIDTATLSSIASCAYFDATYLQSSIGYRLQNLEVAAAEELYKLHKRSEIIPPQYLRSQYLTWIDMVLLIKYPFMLGRLKLYPQVGVEYAPCLSYEDDEGNDLKILAYEDDEGNEQIDTLSTEELERLNLFYLEVGIGMDIVAITDQRTNALWHFRIETLLKYNPFLDNYVFSASLLYGCVFP